MGLIILGSFSGMLTTRLATFARYKFPNKEKHKETEWRMSFFDIDVLFLYAGRISYPARAKTRSAIQTTSRKSVSMSSVVAPPQTTEKPRGAALARVLKVGDRVRRGPDWDPYDHQVSLLLLRPALT